MDSQDTPGHYRAILRDEVELIRQKRQSRRKACQLDEQEYGSIEDIVLLQAVEDLLLRVSNKDHPHYRKGMWHLGAMAHDLRKKLRDCLKK